MQEDFNQSIESMKEIFVDIAQNVLPLIQMALEPIMAIMSGISTVVGYIIEGFKTLAPVLVPILGIMTAMWIKTKAVAIMSVIQKAWTGLGGLPVVGPALAIAAIAGGVGYINSQKVKDAQISPKGGLMVSGEKGTFQLDKEDSVIAGTDLGGNKKPKNNTQSQSSGTSVNVDMSQTNALLQQLISVISAGGDVTLDGQKVGNALNLVSYKTQ
jgi:hypothetical protein